MRQKTEHLAMIFPNLHTEYGRVVAVGSSPRLEFWLRLDGVEELILSWQGGDCGLVLSVPHAGLLGQDRWELELFSSHHISLSLSRCEGGDLLCTDTGHVITTRQGTKDRPLVHYGRDAGTDVIAAAVKEGLRCGPRPLTPHVVTCHIHRSKVEVNVDLARRAVHQRGQEAEFIHRLYHR